MHHLWLSSRRHCGVITFSLPKSPVFIDAWNCAAGCHTWELHNVIESFTRHLITNLHVFTALAVREHKVILQTEFKHCVYSAVFVLV